MFKRKYNIVLAPLVWAKYRSSVNTDNLETLSSLKIKKIFKDEADNDAKQWFLHRVLSQWLEIHNKEISRDILDRLKKIIKKCNITLNQIEKHELQILEERIFAKERTLKTLDTHLDLLSGENIVARFQKCNLYTNSKVQLDLKINTTKQIWTEKHILQNLQNGILMISNKRIIIDSNSKIQTFAFKDFKWYAHKDFGFEFKIKKDIFLLRIHDQPTLNNTIDYILRKKAKHVIKKCKNY